VQRARGLSAKNAVSQWKAQRHATLLTLYGGRSCCRRAKKKSRTRRQHHPSIIKSRIASSHKRSRLAASDMVRTIMRPLHNFSAADFGSRWDQSPIPADCNTFAVSAKGSPTTAECDPDHGIAVVLDGITTRLAALIIRCPDASGSTSLNPSSCPCGDHSRLTVRSPMAVDNFVASPTSMQNASTSSNVRQRPEILLTTTATVVDRATRYHQCRIRTRLFMRHTPRKSRRLFQGHSNIRARAACGATAEHCAKNSSLWAWE
jgi:hypothetical protein